MSRMSDKWIEQQQYQSEADWEREQERIRSEVAPVPEPTMEPREDEEYVRAGEVLARAVRHMHYAIDAGQCPRAEWDHLRLAMGWPIWD